jgi:16S rRNA (guanine(966)-N(2))-methyltransferase RsmD
MRESIFAVLGDLTNRSFLDLFSGSGIIALEAASRGASEIEAVEADPLKRKTIVKNVSMSPVRIRCRFMAVELYIQRAKKSFDLIFCDPPFPYRFKKELLTSIAASVLLGSDSLLLIHRPKFEELKLSSERDGISIQETRYYGASAVDFFVKSY